ncbi:Bug family tripartite tricarboxylate transporter substrate binding protein [Nitrincola alkalisediminis]|uniref:Bug family tripartite tricarboxylate transporter substrate binding protein n=1 Tax=Nitrincola alkalisediminis TaxID=1366656 RepID=UPI001873EDC0|nr:tripartite tricarboxylate transporter substrate binding protein [Nitrincola alkalisediminis]
MAISLRKSIKLAACALAIPLLVSSTLAAADNYPNRPIEAVVGFGTGGSADRMTRIMSNHLSQELGVPVRVTNRPGAGTQIAANYILNAPDEGYHLFSSTFAPYLTNTILAGDATYSVDDFSYVNFQWFDQDLIAVNKDSGYSSLAEVIETIKNQPGKVRASVVQGSAGHLMARILLDAYGIPQNHLNLVTYNSGGEARTAVAGGQVDLVLISAEGSESIREFLIPLAIVSDERIEQWDVPTVNEALAPLNIEVPVLQGSMRGFAVSAEFERRHPERYKKLADAMQNVLAKKDLQEELRRHDIGGIWVGPEKSKQMMKENFETFSRYAQLLN